MSKMNENCFNESKSSIDLLIYYFWLTIIQFLPMITFDPILDAWTIELASTIT